MYVNQYFAKFLKNFFQDIVLGDFVMTIQRNQLAKYTRIYMISNFMSLMSSQKIIDSNHYNILSIFQIEIWILIILFLILSSIFGIRKIKMKTFPFDFINSMFDHFECLTRNCSKLIN